MDYCRYAEMHGEAKEDEATTTTEPQTPSTETAPAPTFCTPL